MIMQFWVITDVEKLNYERAHLIILSIAVIPEKTLTGKSLILKKLRFYVMCEQENTLTTFLLPIYID